MTYKLKSTKLWLCLFLVAVITGLNYIGTVDSRDYIDFIKWIFGIYVLGNVGSKAVAKKVNS